MAQTPLKTVILGLNEQGLLLLECAKKTGFFEIEAVADKDAELAQKTAAEYKCKHYDDYRLAIMQSGVDVVFAAAPLHTCAEYIHIALDKKMHVLRISPPARTFEELTNFVRQAANSDVQFAVASLLRLNKAFAAFREYVEQNRNDNLFLVTAQCGIGQSQYPWQRDPKLAGGGILLYNCYEIIDQLVLSFGTPDEVYAVNTSQAPDRKQRLYVTEDTSVITMKFADTLTVNVIASKTLWPHERILTAYGKDRKVCIDEIRLTITDNLNTFSEKAHESATTSELMIRFLADFAQNIIGTEQAQPLSNGADHLATMALMESAYLSARTGAPESPQRILQMSQNMLTRYLIK
ncbi:MAG: Gfo/Idh/MocA family oxidoreductase [Sedimentisphaerales bacterium]|nr:Gfo/Idh/MocA family oxidoreductase [Sedimentisphaerales bacterium]